MADLNRAWLLVIDDVGTADVKNLEWYQSIYYQIINHRYVADLPLVLTTNLPPGELSERLGARSMSRLEGKGSGINLDGPDRRDGR